MSDSLAFADQVEQLLIEGVEVLAEFFERHAHLPECGLPSFVKAKLFPGKCADRVHYPIRAARKPLRGR